MTEELARLGESEVAVAAAVAFHSERDRLVLVVDLENRCDREVGDVAMAFVVPHFVEQVRELQLVGGGAGYSAIRVAEGLRPG